MYDPLAQYVAESGVRNQLWAARAGWAIVGALRNPPYNLAMGQLAVAQDRLAAAQTRLALAIEDQNFQEQLRVWRSRPGNTAEKEQQIWDKHRDDIASARSRRTAIRLQAEDAKNTESAYATAVIGTLVILCVIAVRLFLAFR